MSQTSASAEEEIQAERVKAVFKQVPAAVLVTAVNATLLVAVLSSVEPKPGIYFWLAVTIFVAAARLTLWWVHRRAAPIFGQYRLWSLINTCVVFTAGAVWGLGAVFLMPQSEVYELFWIFLIGGMCAGAASLHYPHWSTVAAFIVPAGLPLAIRFALDGSARRIVASSMIMLFIAVLLATSRRASCYFGENLRLRFDLVRRTRELDATNEKLVREMAEHRATEASLHHAQKMEALGQLTGGIAHDFNNLLMIVLGSLSLLRKRLAEGDIEASRLLDTAVQGAERGAALTERLLAFGRRQALEPEVVQLPALVSNMATLLSSSLGASVHVTMQFPEALSPVEVDPNQLELALLNLAVNARDAMPSGGEIAIGAREGAVRWGEADAVPPGGYVVLSVTDTGYGMDEATLTRATEPFFTTKTVGKGTGLGLSVVHGFAAQSGGQFLLHSTKGVGTVAELWLPRAQSAVVRPQGPRIQQADGIGGR